MDPTALEKCLDIVRRLRKRSNLSDFNYKKESLIAINGYTARVENPIDFASILDDLQNGTVTSPENFAQLMRRMGGNSLRFCLEGGNLAIRTSGRRLLDYIDKELEELLPQVDRLHGEVHLCLDLLDKLLKYILGKGQRPATFWNRLELELDLASLCEDYAEAVKFPMDFGRLTSELLEFNIPSQEFLAKAELVFSNCISFWKARNAMELVNQAEDLLTFLSKEASLMLPVSWRDRRLPPHSSPRPSYQALMKCIERKNKKEEEEQQAKLTVNPAPAPLLLVKGGTTSKSLPSSSMPVLKMAGGGETTTLKLPRLKSVSSSSNLTRAPSLPLPQAPPKLSLLSIPPSAEDEGQEASPAPRPKLQLKKSMSLEPDAEDSWRRGSIKLKLAPPLSSTTSPSLEGEGASRDAFSVASENTEAVVVEASPRLSIRPSLPITTATSSTTTGGAGGLSQPQIRVSVAKTEMEVGGLKQQQQQPILAGEPIVLGQKRRLEDVGSRETDEENGKKPRTNLPIRLKVAPSSVPPSASTPALASTTSLTLPLRRTRPPEQPLLKKKKKKETQILPEGDGKKSAGGGGGGGITQLNEWERKCHVYLEQLDKFITDLSMTGKGASSRNKKLQSRYNFEKPVVVLYPEIEKDYLAKIERPMDISTIRLNLKEHAYTSAKAFLVDVDLIFKNAIQYNDDATTPYLMELVAVARHLMKYLDALALEMLPLEDDYADERLNLSEQRREEQRKVWQDKASKQLAKPLDQFRFFYNQMRELINALKKEGKGKVGEYFTEEVNRAQNPNYYAIIERPICLKDIVKSMEQGSVRIGEVVSNLDLVWQNALQFNSPGRKLNHKISESICEAAESMKKSMEEKLPMIYLKIWEHVDREAELRETLKKLRAEDEKLRAEEQQRLLLQQEQQQQQDEEEKETKAYPGEALLSSPGAMGGGVAPPSHLPSLAVSPGPSAAEITPVAPGVVRGRLKAKRDKRKELEQEKKQEELRRKEREIKLKQSISQEVWSRIEQQRARYLECQKQQEEEEKQEEKGKKKGEEEEEGGAQADQDKSEEKEKEEYKRGPGAAPISLGPLDISNVGKSRGNGGALLELNNNNNNIKWASNRGGVTSAAVHEFIEKQLARVPLHDDDELKHKADDESSSGAGSEGVEDEESIDSTWEEEESDDSMEVGEGGDFDAEGRRVRLLIQVVPPLMLEADDLAGIPMTRREGVLAPSLVHLTLIADYQEESLHAGGGDIPDEMSVSSTVTRRRRKEKEKALTWSVSVNGSKTVLVRKKAEDEVLEEVADENKRRRSSSKQMALEFSLGNLDVTLKVKASQTEGRGSRSRGTAKDESTNVQLSSLLRDIKIRKRRLMEESERAEVLGSNRTLKMLDQAYAWMDGLDLVLWEEGNLAMSAAPVLEEHKGGRVIILHFVSLPHHLAFCFFDQCIRHPALASM